MNKRVIIYTIIFFLIDQITKMIASTYLPNNTIVVIPEFFKLRYALNTGAAWSILNNHIVILIIITIIILFLILLFMKNFKDNKRNNIAFALLFGGILGNLVDRIFHGYVIDFLDFKIFSYDYPIFNVADMLIVFGIILIIVAIIKGEDNENKSRGRNK